MENNVISMHLDVKIDLKDRKRETSMFRNWTKCLVKIEAIKCFPCYVRITFTKQVEDIESTFCVRINIPGLSVQFASSRTKTYSYGLFWKQNRKRCSIFFGLDSQISCERHMRWMKKSIKNLELHRQEMLETRRASRSQYDDNNLPKTPKTARKQIEPKTVPERKNLQDILRPLPQIPDADNSWCRRESGMSGIYEEIKDGENSRRFSRASIVSGIYEEMKFPNNFESISEHVIETPPPLPPRKRLNTFSSQDGPIPRSYTNPETDLAKKKNYLTVLENLFSRSKRAGSVTDEKVTGNSPTKIIQTPVKEPSSKQYNVTPRPKRKAKGVVAAVAAEGMSNKRNSFSSPDLTKFNQFDVFDALDDLSSLSSELQLNGGLDDCASIEFVNLNNSSPIETYNHGQSEASDVENVDQLNISDRIQSNFNFSCNSSTINLVGANMNSLEPEVNPNVVLDDVSGYCVMAPIKKNVKNSTSDSDKENECVTPQPNADSSKNDETIYVNMNNNSPENEFVYQNVPPSNESKHHTLRFLNEINTVNDLIKTPRRLSTSIDDKIPSYYPNSCDTMKTRRRTNSSSDNDQIKHLTNVKVNRRENLYISSPQKILDQRKKLKSKQKDIGDHKKEQKDNQDGLGKSNKTTPNIYVTAGKRSDSFSSGKSSKIVAISIEKAESDSELAGKNSSDERSPKLYQKYATLARISPNKYLEKCAKKSSTDFGNIKKFASLPRFKKIDFSPLKMKISNALQRH